MRHFFIKLVQPLILAGFALFPASGLTQNYNLESIITIAQQSDPWLDVNRLRERAAHANSIAVGQLPDPTFSFNIANLPTDGFQLDQEPFTQFRLGISQQFPRGNSLSLRQKRQAQQANQHPIEREARRAFIRLAVSKIWIDAQRAAQSLQQVEQDRVLVEQFIDTISANYSSALGEIRQQDVVSAQLGLIRLDDKITLLRGELNAHVAQLNEWIGYDINQGISAVTIHDIYHQSTPENVISLEAIESLTKPAARNQLVEVLQLHPTVRIIDQAVKSKMTDVQLAKQAYKPQWGVTGSYATRRDEPNGRSRADFFSIGVTVDVPLFNKTQQDQHVEESKFNLEATKTQKRVRIQSMLTELSERYQTMQYLVQRENLYKTQLLPQVSEQAQTSLSAYTHDDGSLADAIQAQINQLDTTLSFIDIHSNKLKQQIHIRYLLTGHPPLTAQLTPTHLRHNATETKGTK